ncbi:MAG: YihY/virulence factor BrkB family protein [Solirubrobacterales bacterium]
MSKPSEPKQSLPRRAWNLLDATQSRFADHRTTDWAGALTYYSMLSIFPGMLVLISLLGLVGESITDDLVDNFQELAPGPVRDIFISAIRGIQGSQSSATVLLIGSALIALYSASAYIGAFIRASNVIWGVREQRRFYQTIPLRIGITVLLLVLLAGVGIAVVLSGPLTDEIGRVIGFDFNGTLAWGLLRWPVLIALAAVVLAILYNLSPDMDDQRFKAISPGSLLAVFIWVVVSFGFSEYVSYIATYSRTYGSLAGIVIFLVWLWLTNVAVLFGMELDSELRRYRLAHGHSRWRASRS